MVKMHHYFKVLSNQEKKKIHQNREHNVFESAVNMVCRY